MSVGVANTEDAASPTFWNELFSTDTPVSRARYVSVGLLLGLIKYAIEAITVGAFTGQFYTPVDFVNPWLSSKASFLLEHEIGSYLGIAWIAFTLPFVWIAISMSVRRAADVGITPWFGMLMLLPLANLAAMALLSLLPSRLFGFPETKEIKQQRQEMAAAFRPPTETSGQPVINQDVNVFGDLIWAIFVGCATQVFVGMTSVWMFRLYGFVLFFSTPVIAGAVSGYVFNRRHRYGLGVNFLMTLLMNALSFIAMLCVGLDGAICLFMAFPLMAPLSFIGCTVGQSVAVASMRGRMNEDRGLIGMIILLPVALCFDSLDRETPVHRVTTVVEIDAPIEEVWNQVIAFPEITDTPAWYFRLGIASPVRARIEGTGVGAHRYCEFTTGAFVEPITHWNPPMHLGFDVTSQPQPMTEWTPFSGLHPPHLDDGFVSERGEFRLKSIGPERTRLAGTTWYHVDVRPRLYWKIWSDALVHRIHLRVLNHIRSECER